jgi:signal transduction histidine kinase
VLNSINVSASVISDKVNKSRASNLVKVVNLINDNAKVPDFLTEDPKGKQVPGYLTVLVDYLNKEREEISTELELLSKNIQHIKDIVSMQQAYANVSGMHERVRVEDLVEDAIQMNMGALSRHEVKLVRDYQVSLEIVVDKPKVLQVLVNLIRNAKYACDASDQDVNLLTISIKKSEYFHAAIEVNDNGDGIPEENLTRIFQHGFTTRKDGNGFGLHSAALAVKELGGLLTAMSDGPGQGATFVLELPEKPPSDEP